MNERIKELWSQAGGHYNSGNQHTWPEYTIDDPEKFAELIVKECMACSTWVGKMNTNSVEPVHTAHAINQRIKQHFGVEE
jgi:hypothetical protein